MVLKLDQYNKERRRIFIQGIIISALGFPIFVFGNIYDSLQLFIFGVFLSIVGVIITAIRIKPLYDEGVEE